ncbi:hypothetical protein HWV62_25965 [Athelia sp. TMB]|nr:hypothetical protein HWV62_25965 [Athelia sp. TMB]
MIVASLTAKDLMSVGVLRAFLDTKDAKLEEERAWLQEMGVDCVLSETTFLGCCKRRAHPEHPHHQLHI